MTGRSDDGRTGLEHDALHEAPAACEPADCCCPPGLTTELVLVPVSVLRALVGTPDLDSPQRRAQAWARDRLAALEDRS